MLTISLAVSLQNSSMKNWSKRNSFGEEKIRDLPDDDDSDCSLLLGVVVTVMNCPFDRPETIN